MNTDTTIKKRKKIPTKKVLLWVSLISIIMIFAGLTSAYIVRQAEGNWLHFELPYQFYLSTVLILLSSLTVHVAIRSVKQENYKKTPFFLALSLLLGLGFSITQFWGWTALVNQGIYLVGNPSGSFLYVITGLHVLHLFAGLIVLGVSLVRSLLRKYEKDQMLGLELSAIYWHFLDGLWVYLFFFLLLVR